MSPVTFRGKFLTKSAANPGARAIGTSRLTANERAMTSVYTDAVRSLTADLDTSALSRALSSQSVSNAVQVFRWDKFGDRMSDSRIPLLQQARDTGKAEAAALKNIVGSFAFNVTDPRATAWAAARSGELVVNISDQLRNEIRGLITSSFVNQIDPREIAREIPRAIGLFPRWANAVENSYQRNLDGFLGQGMSRSEAEAKAGVLADAYRERLIDARARMIARTEVMTAANQGRYISWQQAEDRGLIDLSSAYKEWIAEADACEDCQFVDGEFAPADGVFESTGDEMPPAHPNCRCTAVLVPAEDVDPAVLEEQAAARAERNGEEDTGTVTPPDEESSYPVEVTDVPGTPAEDLTPTVEEAPVEATLEERTSYSGATVTPEEFAANIVEIVTPIIDSTDYGLRFLDVIGDPAAGMMQSALGFDALPAAVTSTEYEALISEGWTQLFRGIASESPEEFAQFSEQFTSSDAMFNGKGLFGNGTYATPDLETAQSFASGESRGIGVTEETVRTGGGGILDLALHPEANVVDINDLWQMREVERDAIRAESAINSAEIDALLAPIKAERDSILADLDSKWTGERNRWGEVSSYDLLETAPKDVRDRADALLDLINNPRPIMSPETLDRIASIQAREFLLEDDARFAMSRGYDAIVNPNPMIGWDPATGQPNYVGVPYWNLLNRGALAVRTA